MVRYSGGVVWCDVCLQFYNENNVSEHIHVHDRQIKITPTKLWCIRCGKELSWKTAIGYIPPHKSWVCWFYCKECYEENSKNISDTTV